MTREEAQEYAKTMTFKDAIYNLKKARCIPYRKATFIKIDELLRALDKEPCADCISRQSVIDINERYHGQMPNNINHQIWQEIKDLPNSQPKME